MILYNTAPQFSDMKSALESLNQGVDINTEIPGRGSLLHIATRSGDLETVELLIMRGADINLKSNAGNPALMIAVLYQWINLVDFLLKNQADTEVADRSKGRTALHYAVLSADYIIVKLLLDGGANYTSQDAFNKTPEMYAFDPSIIKLFEERKALDLKIRAAGDDTGSSSSAKVCKP